jgi:hypothetical protein
VRVNAGGFAWTLAIVLVLLVAACDKERCAPAPQTITSPDQSADVRKAAENSVRFSASNPDSVRFRGVLVWPQAVNTSSRYADKPTYSVPPATPSSCSSSSSP